MTGICVDQIDTNIGHASSCPNPFHQGHYKAGLQSNVYVGGKLVIVIGDGMTGCCDIAVAGSSTVFINGIGVHRIGDATSGHDLGGCPGPWPPNAALTGSSTVIAG
jgi:uncharacterized Zn-binding protein involved in type VI secretion